MVALSERIWDIHNTVKLMRGKTFLFRLENGNPQEKFYGT